MTLPLLTIGQGAAWRILVNLFLQLIFSFKMTEIEITRGLGRGIITFHDPVKIPKLVSYVIYSVEIVHDQSEMISILHQKEKKKKTL